MSDSVLSSVTNSSDKYIGRVKWFNNKTGYGFISITDGPKSGTDVFVHHSSIKVDSEQYKYLVQGEYLEFSLLTSTSGNHEFQAGDVSGIKGGKLMCETRRELKTARSQYLSVKGVSDDVSEKAVSEPRSVRVKSRGSGPREETGKWNYVGKAKKTVSKQSNKSADA
jgi:CspA family cold shock protein